MRCPAGCSNKFKSATAAHAHFQLAHEPWQFVLLPHEQASKESFSDVCGQLAFNVINRLTESAKVLASFSMLTREGHALKLMEALHEENGG